MHHNWPFFFQNNHLKEAFRAQGSMAEQVIYPSEFKFEVNSDIRGHWEVTMTSEATRIAVWGIMYIDMGVVEVNDFKSFITSAPGL